MESLICEWDAIGILRELTKSKLVFIETKDVVETTLALEYVPGFRRFQNCCSDFGSVDLLTFLTLISAIIVELVTAVEELSFCRLRVERYLRELTLIGIMVEL